MIYGPGSLETPADKVTPREWVQIYLAQVLGLSIDEWVDDPTYEAMTAEEACDVESALLKMLNQMLKRHKLAHYEDQFWADDVPDHFDAKEEPLPPGAIRFPDGSIGIPETDDEAESMYKYLDEAEREYEG